MAQESQPVVLITGASSGIGRATAVAFAERGARLVLVSRAQPDEAAALAVLGECRARGGDAIWCSADITDAVTVESAAAAAIGAYGRIDVWINGAAVLMFGRFADVPPDVFRRVIETNLLGTVNASRIALAQFARQGDRGTLINIASMLGTVPEPFLSAYTTSKFAVRGFTACLRQEMRERPGIHVCAVLPPAVDTPVYQKAANYMGRPARALLPIYAPETAARAIVRLADRPRAELRIGAFSVLLDWGARAAPMTVRKLIALFGPKLQFEDGAAPPNSGNVHESAGPQTVAGGWQEYWRNKLRRRG